MKFPNSTGLSLAILDGFSQGDEFVVRCIDNYNYPFHDFMLKAQTNEWPPTDAVSHTKNPRLFVISGHRDKVFRVERSWKKRIKNVFMQLLQRKQMMERINDKELKETERYCLESLYCLYLSELVTDENIYYPEAKIFHNEGDDLVILVFYMSTSPSDHQFEKVKDTVNFWIDRERPFLKGYQCLIRSFILRNMVGRKVLASFPDSYGNWGLLLEGGMFLPLKEDLELGLSKLKSEHIGEWTAGEVEEILLNPIYSFGFYYEHSDLVCEWFYVFLYVLATLEEDKLKRIDFELLYRNFYDYIAENICPYIQIEQRIITISDYVKVLRITLENVRSYLKGKEEKGVSKNILLMMRNRYAYLPELHQFIIKNSSLTLKDIFNSGYSNKKDWRYALDRLEGASSSFEKGTSFENLAQSFIHMIPGFKITDVRAKKGRAEVDIYCCNISYDSCLWRLGALVLIECKNRLNKTAVSDIRNLVPTMEAKGIHGAIIFSSTGFTSIALKEIKYQLSGGKMIIPITLEEIQLIDKSKGAYDLINEKIKQFDRLTGENSDHLYF
ncbi:hypothetical protein C0Q44_21715 [Paenibacillus sp. PCH8]|nr:hypothetical protein C0Q44_21715 [Paenibacillus sp. PCH8]